MDKKVYTIISITCFFAGILFFALYNEWIIIKSPRIFSDQLPTSLLKKKEIAHFYFHHNKWKTEKQEILWAENDAINATNLINAWLSIVDEERITQKKITLQSALISTSGSLYISFDQNLLTKEDPIFKKWMLIEGLLKTIAHNGIPIHHVQFLVQHQQLHDQHLDFSLPWPLHGFISTL
jgi:hypothetical protein